MKLSDTFKQIVEQIINNYAEDLEQGRSIEELIVTDLTENGFIDDEFGELFYNEDGEVNFEIEEQVHNLVSAHVRNALQVK